MHYVKADFRLYAIDEIAGEPSLMGDVLMVFLSKNNLVQVLNFVKQELF